MRISMAGTGSGGQRTSRGTAGSRPLRIWRPVIRHGSTNLDFDQALWGESDFPASGFVFTMARPQAARIAKTEVNSVLGYEPGVTWQGNLLITEDNGRKLANATELVIAG